MIDFLMIDAPAFILMVFMLMVFEVHFAIRVRFGACIEMYCWMMSMMSIFVMMLKSVRFSSMLSSMFVLIWLLMNSIMGK